MKKITKLTEAQEARLIELREEWLRIGYSSAPLDKKVAVEIIGEFYTRIQQPKPVVMFFSSPMMCILAWGVLKSLFNRESVKPQLRAQLGAQLRAQLWDQLGAQLRAQLRAQLGAQLRAQLWDQLRAQLWDQLRAQLWDQLWAQLGAQLRVQLGAQLGDQLRVQLGAQLGDQLRVQLGAQLSNYFGGAHWCYWEVFYKFCSEIGVKYTADQEKLLDLWIDQSRHLHWWFPYKGIALVSERHTIVKVDSQSRLHCETGQACGYSDGWGIWAWHGIRVSQELVERPETITAKAILTENNAELRRIMIERIGMERFITESGAKNIHSHDRGILYAINLPNDPEGVLKAVQVTCPSTGRRYFLRVPPQINRADDAIAWTFGFEVTKQYQPLIET